MTDPLTYRVGSIVIVDDGTNIRIYKGHTPSESIIIERSDRDDLLTCLMQAQDKRVDLATGEKFDGSLWKATHWQCTSCRNQHTMQTRRHAIENQCRVCGAMPDLSGERIHGRGCYAISADGGGSDWPE